MLYNSTICIIIPNLENHSADDTHVPTSYGMEIIDKFFAIHAIHERSDESLYYNILRSYCPRYCTLCIYARIKVYI